MRGTKAKLLRQIARLKQDLPEVEYISGQPNATKFYDPTQRVLRTFQYTGTIRLGRCRRALVKRGKKNLQKGSFFGRTLRDCAAPFRQGLGAA